MQSALVFGLIAAAVTLLILLAVVVGMQASLRRRAHRESTGRSGRVTPTAAPVPNVAGSGTEAPERHPAGIEAAFHCVAFGITRFGSEVRGAHAEVLQRARKAIAASIDRSEYFPRKPLLLPQLLRAINDSNSTRQELAQIILQDPVLAGDVLKRANSSYYRTSHEPIENIDRAIVRLGMDGLRAVVATSIMQPVFRLPKGYFDSFSAVTWEHAARSATAAGLYASRTGSRDRFSAHLLGLLTALGPIVLFRLVADVYRSEGVAPQAEVFIRLLDEEADRTSALIAESWELPDSFPAAIREQADGVAATDMTPLARALYFGRRCAMLSMLHDQNEISPEQAEKAMLDAGLDAEVHAVLWQAMTGRTGQD